MPEPEKTEDDENECTALEKYVPSPSTATRWLASDEWRAMRFIMRQIKETTGWGDDDLEKLASGMLEIESRMRKHYRSELMAIARDLGRDVGLKVTSEPQAAVVIAALLEMDDDDEDDEAVAPLPQLDDELVLT